MSDTPKRSIPGVKDTQGAYIKADIVDGAASKNREPLSIFTLPAPDSLSIDTLMAGGLQAIHGIIRACLKDIDRNTTPSRETVQNLKDAMAMLRDLKEHEKDLLDDLTEEELAAHAAKAKK